MSMMRKISWIAFLLCSLIVVLTACEGSGNKTAEPSEKAPAKASSELISTEPVTLKVWMSAAMTDEEFAMYFINPTKKKFPYITPEQVRSAQGAFLPDVIQAGQAPDNIYNPASLDPLLQLDLPMDLRELIKKNNFQTKRVIDELVDSRYNGPNGEVYGLPITQNEPLLWYNKGLFNKFGVSFPKDALTWEEAVDLTRRLTRVDGGVQYYGFFPYHSAVAEWAGNFRMPLVDPKTDKAIISPPWYDIFTTMMNVFNVPGNKTEQLLNSTQARNEFIADQTLSMIIHQYNAMFSFFDTLQKNNVDFDFVTPPRFSSVLDTKKPNSFNQLVISKSTKHPDQAFQLITTVLSDEVQTEAAKVGKIPALSSDAVQKQFGVDNALLKSKNVQALFFAGKLPVKADVNLYDPLVTNEVNKAFAKVYDGTDINSALREAEELANKDIAVEKAK